MSISIYDVIYLYERIVLRRLIAIEEIAYLNRNKVSITLPFTTYVGGAYKRKPLAISEGPRLRYPKATSI